MPAEIRSAADAFDALRAEVGDARAELRGLAVAIAGKTVPDYALTLGEMARRLGAIESRLADLWQLLPPARLRGESEMTTAMQAAAGELQARAKELRAATGTMVGQQAERRRMAGRVAAGVLAGIVLSFGAAALLPRPVGGWMAATLIGGSRWQAGAILMYQADPATFGRMIRLSQACPRDSTTELCEAAIAVRTIPPASQAPPSTQ